MKVWVVNREWKSLDTYEYYQVYKNREALDNAFAEHFELVEDSNELVVFEDEQVAYHCTPEEVLFG